MADRLALSAREKARGVHFSYLFAVILGHCPGRGHFDCGDVGV